MAQADDLYDVFFEVKISFSVPKWIPTDDLIEEFEVEELAGEALEAAFPGIKYEPELGIDFSRTESRPSLLKIKFNVYADRNTIPIDALLKSHYKRSLTNLSLQTGRVVPNTNDPISWICNEVTVSRKTSDKKGCWVIANTTQGEYVAPSNFRSMKQASKKYNELFEIYDGFSRWSPADAITWMYTKGKNARKVREFVDVYGDETFDHAAGLHDKTTYTTKESKAAFQKRVKTQGGGPINSNSAEISASPFEESWFKEELHKNRELRSKVIDVAEKIRERAHRPESDPVRVSLRNHRKANNKVTYDLKIYVGRNRRSSIQADAEITVAC